MEKSEFTLSNGNSLLIYPDHPEKSISHFIDQYLKPYYQKTNNWIETLHKSITEIERISSYFRLKRGSLNNQLLTEIENRLPSDIADLKGLDKIEILFEDVDDYIQNIQDFVKSSDSEEKIRLKVSTLIEQLNLYELSELLIHFAKKCK